MSQNPTIFPGVGPEESAERGSSYDRNDFSYSRSARRESDATVFPGMDVQPQPDRGGGRQIPESRRSTKPVVGFLYSISRTALGEYWPLYIGPNTLGSAPSCDICLREATVSKAHAEIVIRRMKNPEKIEASISDSRSTNGTMVNGMSLSAFGTGVECRNGDIISVGESYQLVLFLIDAKELGLHVAEQFIPLESITDGFPDSRYDSGLEGGESPYREDFPPRFKGGPTQAPYTHTHNESTAAASGTVGMDSGSNGPKKGGTIW